MARDDGQRRPAQCRSFRVAGAVLTAGVLLSACGAATTGVASIGTTTTTSAPATGGDLLLYAKCMRTHGVAGFPDSRSFSSSSGIKAAKGQIAQVSQSEANSPSFNVAQRACATYDAPSTPSTTPVSAKEMAKLLAVSRCMRTHGVSTFPDPNPTTGQLTTPAGLDKISPEVIAALTACAALGRAAGLGPPTTAP